uniref:Metalloendopeptidase n=1 Tax=Sander lucioperca TaxID=283035 RepID=A0A8C9X3G5_SANLU
MDLRTTVSLLLLLLLGLFRLKCIFSFLLIGSRDFLNAMKCLDATNSCLWPKSANGNVEMPYLLSDSYDNTDISEIQRAMKGFESNTCIRFIPRQSQEAYLSLEPTYGCASLLGRTGDMQVVSLQRFGCVSLGIIQHELLHALGFYHEHTRSDRDQYFVYDFQKQDTNNLNTPYDYSSIMHYGRSAFAKPGLDSITPIPDSSVPIGQTDGMSKIDILRVNRLYQC